MSLNEYIIISIQITQNLYMGPIDNKSGNGLAPTRRQAIIWTNANPIRWRIYAWVGEVS